MGIDINLLRTERGGDAEAVFASERKRYRGAEQNFAQRAAELDEVWRRKRFELDGASQAINAVQREITQAKKQKLPCEAELARLQALKAGRERLEGEERQLVAERDGWLKQVGNLVHESVVVSADEQDNEVVRSWGALPEMRVEPGSRRYAHHQLLEMIGGFDARRGQKIAGHRGYFLKGVGALLNMALANYGMHFLARRQCTILHTPFFMKRGVMAETCQLSDFDEQLYKVSTGRDEPDNEFYLVATSEQPISAYHCGESIDARELPLRYCGFSSCFRKEAGAHGKDNLGIFRVHQFEKIEQFSLTEPEESWAEHERMIATAEEFYRELRLPYRVVNIVSGALNDAAAKKYDLEAWFPSYKAYRELVSCSNCTDFQSRGLEVKCFGGRKDAGKGGEAKADGKKEDKATRLVHMLNGTLCATERTMCCILENYQTDEGVVVPEVLRPYVGADFMPFTAKPEAESK